MCSALSRYTGRGFVTFSRLRLPRAGLLGMSWWIDGDLEDLGEQEQVHVDRAVQQRPLGAAVAATATVDDHDRPRLAFLSGCR